MILWYYFVLNKQFSLKLIDFQTKMRNISLKSPKLKAI